MIPIFYVKNGKYVTDPIIKRETIQKKVNTIYKKTSSLFSRFAKNVSNKKS